MAEAPFVAGHSRGAIVTVWVVPGARRTEVVGPHGDALKIRVAAPPEGGKANRLVGALLQSAVGAPVELIRGASARRKHYLVEGVTPDRVAGSLRSFERRSGA
jgi:uncharacterized protein (TIGR00251 family)